MTPPRRFRWGRFVGAAIALSLLGLAGCAAWRVNSSIELARASEPFIQHPPAPSARLLIVGDSTAVGTGASSPSMSVAGRIGQAHPRLWIDNFARDGASFAGVREQLSDAPRYDVVLVQAGGNDVIRLRDMQQVQRDVEQVVSLALERAQVVVLMPAGNVGNAPFFLPPLSWWMTQRSRALHEVVRAAAARDGVRYVDLYHPREADPFVLQPQLNARDGLHPSDAGYAQWYDALQRQAQFDTLLNRSSRTR